MKWYKKKSKKHETEWIYYSFNVWGYPSTYSLIFPNSVIMFLFMCMWIHDILRISLHINIMNGTDRKIHCILNDVCVASLPFSCSFWETRSWGIPGIAVVVSPFGRETWMHNNSIKSVSCISSWLLFFTNFIGSHTAWGSRTHTIFWRGIFLYIWLHGVTTTSLQNFLRFRVFFYW